MPFKYALYPGSPERQQEVLNMVNRQSNTAGKTKKMVMLALLAALIVVLQIICTFIKFGPFSITLALAPMIIGAALYGPSAGAFLGFVFGLVVFLTGLFGWDGGTVNLLMSNSAIGTILICFVKGTAAGYASGWVYTLLRKKNRLLAVIVAGIVCPVVNTGLFILGMFIFFLGTLESWAGGQAMLYYIIVGLTGINFLIELFVNIILSSGITRILKSENK